MTLTSVNVGETDDLEDDNVINEDGKNGGDEDDHDPAEIPIGQTFDLALAKSVNTNVTCRSIPRWRCDHLYD